MRCTKLMIEAVVLAWPVCHAASPAATECVETAGLADVPSCVFLFNYTSLAEVAALSCPKNGRSITVVGEVARKRHVSGRYKVSNLARLMRMIQILWPDLTVQETEAGWVIYGEDVR